MIRNLAPIAAGAILLGGCVYPYESAFQSCDNEAGACYQVCEGEPDEGGAKACRMVCEDAANQCFDDAYGSSGSSSGYAYGGSWYGSYGYWRPRYGYLYSYDYYDPYYYGGRRGYGRHGHRGDHRRHYDRRGHGGGDGRGHGRHGRGDGQGRGGSDPGATPPPTGVAPPTPQPRARPRVQQPHAEFPRDRRREPKKDD